MNYLNEKLMKIESINKRLKTSVKEWYTETYPDDELGNEIKSDVTFKDLVPVYFEDVSSYLHFYNLKLGEKTDTIIREKVSQEVAILREEIYNA